uniref:Nerve growth factor n=1 Tax=Serinus canaria TaxID=9135 RepID=A0A8C9NIZ2_SERCA
MTSAPARAACGKAATLSLALNKLKCLWNSEDLLCDKHLTLLVIILSPVPPAQQLHRQVLTQLLVFLFLPPLQGSASPPPQSLPSLAAFPLSPGAVQHRAPAAGRAGPGFGISQRRGALNRTARSRRSTHPVLHRGEFSVCDSVSMWVGDKTTATDIKGKEVTVLGEVNINNNIFKQYFFETKCRDPKPVSGGCRGIDAKHWNSYCTTTHTFVKALTMEGKQAAWRFIRIDTACVCVLSRKAARP